MAQNLGIEIDLEGLGAGLGGAMNDGIDQIQGIEDGLGLDFGDQEEELAISGR